MNDVLYRSKSAVRKIAGLNREGELDAGGKIDFGVHGPIVEHFGLTVKDPKPLPVDYIVAAAAG